jgi:23S rRNA pseudouridine1911/1915/1917 synthase
VNELANQHLTVDTADQGRRLDVYLADQNIGSRSFVQGLVEDGRVSIDGKSAKVSQKVKAGQVISLDVPEPKKLDKAEPEDIPITLLHEDSDVLVVNKPRGMVVHPAAGNESGTLVNALLFHCQDLSGIGGVLRPGIVHRLDKDTTGVIIVAKNDLAHQSLAAQLKDRTMSRVYWALVEGRVIKDEDEIIAPIARHRVNRKKMAVDEMGRYAKTIYKVVQRFEKPYTLLECRLATGRTHQIRVHLSSIGYPVVADPLYGRPNKAFPMLSAQALHALMLTFRQPTTGEEIKVQATLPDDFQQALDMLGGLRLEN